MRVLLGHCFYRTSAPSGEDAVYRNEKKLLLDNGIDVVPFELHNDDIDTRTFGKRLHWGLETGWSKNSYDAVIRTLQQCKPDVAHFHNIFPQLSPSVYAACVEQGVPIVQTLHNYRYICPNALLLRNGKVCELCIDGSLMNSVRHRCYRGSVSATLPLVRMISKGRKSGAFDSVSTYIALTEFAKTRFIQAGFSEEKVVVKPNFLEDTDYYDNSLSPGDYYVYVGRLSKEKGVDILVNAWCCDDMPELRVLGDGELESPLKEMARRNAANIKFYGYLKRDELMKHVRGARAVIIPSICYEGFPMAVLEAFSLGVPVLASDIGSVGSIIDDGINGYKFEPGNAQALLYAVKLMDTKQDFSVIKTYVRKEFENLYSAKQNYKLLTDIYHGVCSLKHA